MGSDEKEYKLNLPDMCCACLGVPDKTVTIIDKPSSTYQTGHMKIDVPICNNCIKRYRNRRIISIFIPIVSCLIIAALISSSGDNLSYDLIIGGIIGFVIGVILAPLFGKPVHLGSGGQKIYFDNEKYHKSVEQLNDEDVVKELILKIYK